jgi:hypothetical protein
MRATLRTATRTVAALGVVVGVTAISLAGGASVSPPPKAHGQLVHAITTATSKRVTIVSYKFNATYSGKISILWNSSGPSTATITGKGKGTEFGLTSVSGSGSATATAQSDPINGAGVLVGKGETLHLRFLTGSTATAAGGSAPTVVTISGNATITKGAGKFKGAYGTLHVSGEFSIQSTSGKETDSFSATLKGVVKVKK